VEEVADAIATAAAEATMMKMTAVKILLVTIPAHQAVQAEWAWAAIG
jgi:hypothetical protein